MEVYNNFAHVYEIWMFMVFSYILYCGGQRCPPQYKMYGKTMIFKHQYLITYTCNLFEVLGIFIPTSDVALRLPGATMYYICA